MRKRIKISELVIGFAFSLVGFIQPANAQAVKIEDGQTTKTAQAIRLKPVIKRPNEAPVRLKPVIQGAEKRKPAAPTGVIAAPPARDRMSEARRLLQSGKVQEGRELLLKIAADAPQTPDAPEALFLAASALQDLDAARGELRQAVAKYPQSSMARKALARIGEYSFILGDYKESVLAYNAFIELETDPEAERQARIQAAVATLNLGEFENAGNAFTGLARDYPDLAETPEILEGYADALLGIGKPKEAAERYEEIERRFPNYAFVAKVLLGRGLCAELSGDPDAARTIYEKVVAEHGRGIEAALASRRLQDLAEPLAH